MVLFKTVTVIPVQNQISKSISLWNRPLTNQGIFNSNNPQLSMATTEYLSLGFAAAPEIAQSFRRYCLFCQIKATLCVEWPHVAL